MNGFGNPVGRGAEGGAGPMTRKLSMASGRSGRKHLVTRRQEIVLIGQSLDQAALTEMLEAALLTDLALRMRQHR